MRRVERAYKTEVRDKGGKEGCGSEGWKVFREGRKEGGEAEVKLGVRELEFRRRKKRH